MKNTEDIHKLKIQNEQLLDRLQDTCSSSYVSNCHMVDCLEDSRDMMDREKHEKLQDLDKFEDGIDEIKSLVVVEEELDFPLENGYTLLEAVHDSTTLEPTYEGSVTLLMEMYNPTPMEPSHNEKFSLSNPLGDLVLSPTSYTSIFCSIHPYEVWVKGFLLMVPHEEYGLPISHIGDDMTRVPYYLHLHQHPLLHYHHIHIHGCIDETSLSHLKSSCFLCSLFRSDFGGGSSFTYWMK